jgi:hypothetical protein
MRSSKRQVLFNKPDSVLRLSGANKSITGGTLAEGRTSSATYIDTDGLLKNAAANVPVWENGGLRHEGDATNLGIQSEDITTSWLKSPAGLTTFQGTGIQAVITSNYGISPDGTQNADRLQLNLNGGTSTNDRSGIYIPYTVSNNVPWVTNLFIKPLNGESINAIIAYSGTGSLSGPTLASVTYDSLINGWYKIKRLYNSTVVSAVSTRIQILGGLSLNTLDCLVFGMDFKQNVNISSYIPTTTAAVTRATCALSVPLVQNQNFFQKSAIVMRVRAKWANSATAKSWLTPSTTAEGLIDNGSGALTFVDSAANTATANLTSWAADTIILVAIVTDNVTGLMSLSASKDNGATWIDSTDTAFAGLTVGANWLLFSANTQVFECLGWNVIKSNKGFAQMKDYVKSNALRLTQ